MPNFSEGCDMNIIQAITQAIENVEGVKLLDVDPGKATNRTVVTFVGEPEPVVEAAFRAIAKAGELIDMRQHKGEHPRMGATDVCPLIPLANISMEETVEYANRLAKRVGEELNIPVFLYEYASKRPEWRNLSIIRAGEYEGMAAKLATPDFTPDYGKKEMNLKSGVTVIGARDFLIAYNVNLNTTSVRRANSVAFDVREAGRVKKDEKGQTLKDANGEPLRQEGVLKHVKGIGWFIEEYGIAQVSMNLTNISETPLHTAFEACVESAHKRGMRVTGSELVGLVPLKVMLDAGRFFLAKQERSAGVSDAELIKIAVKSMGLNELTPFDPQKKIIEYLLEDSAKFPLINMNLKQFADETASESPAPGGGSISAYIGALGAALGTMVANLSSHKKGYDDRWELFSKYAVRGQEIKNQLLHYVDEDTHSFNKVMEAFGLPKNTPEEKRARTQAIQAATRYATEVPFKVMQLSAEIFGLAKAMVEMGNPNSITDATVGALCARAAVYGAYLNVKINASSLKDKEFVENILTETDRIVGMADDAEKEVVDICLRKMIG